MKVSADHPLVVTYPDYERPSPRSLRTCSSAVSETNIEAEALIDDICSQYVKAYLTKPQRK
jgi:hypothetical protein